MNIKSTKLHAAVYILFIIRSTFGVKCKNGLTVDGEGGYKGRRNLANSPCANGEMCLRMEIDEIKESSAVLNNVAILRCQSGCVSDYEEKTSEELASILPADLKQFTGYDFENAKGVRGKCCSEELCNLNALPELETDDKENAGVKVATTFYYCLLTIFVVACFN